VAPGDNLLLRHKPIERIGNFGVGTFNNFGGESVVFYVAPRSLVDLLALELVYRSSKFFGLDKPKPPTLEPQRLSLT